MKNALDYLLGSLQPEERERFDQWCSDDAGCDLINFMPEGSHEQLIWALQEVYLAERDMESVKAFSSALRGLKNLPPWIA